MLLKEFCWYKPYELLIPSLNTKHSIHTLYDVLDIIFQPRGCTDIDKPFILSADVTSCVDTEMHCVGHVLQGITHTNERVKIINWNMYGTVMKFTRNIIDNDVELVINLDGKQVDESNTVLIGGMETRFKIMVEVIGDERYECDQQMELTLVDIDCTVVGQIENIEWKLDDNTKIASVPYIRKGHKTLIEFVVSEEICLMPFEKCELLGCVLSNMQI